MEHILQFGVNIDDDKIVNSIYESAEKQIVQSLRFKVAQKLLQNRGGYGSISPADVESTRDWNLELTPFSREIVLDFLNDNRDQIIDIAAKYLADRLIRTKAVKEMVGEVLAEQ